MRDAETTTATNGMEAVTPFCRSREETARLGRAETARLGRAETARLGRAETARLGRAETARLGRAETARLGRAETARLGRAETARLGKEIYERDIRQKVEADHHGEVVAIDVDSGSWAMGEEVLQAVERLRAQHPGAINILSERGGYRALVSFVRYLARLHLRIGVQDYRPPSQISKMVLSIVNIGSPAKD